MARDLQMSNKELIKLINSLGIHVNSHMNVLDDRQLSLIRQAINTGLSIEQDRSIIEPAPINRLELNKSAIKGSVLDLIVDNEDFVDESYADVRLNEKQPIQLEQQRLQGLEFSIDELKKAHPYIAVKTMYDNGYPIRDIAKLLGRGQGEISLILNLSKKKVAVM